MVRSLKLCHIEHSTTRRNGLSLLYSPGMTIIRIVFLVVITATTFSISLLTAKIYALGLKSSPYTTKVLLIIATLAPLLFVLTMFFSRATKSSFINALAYPINALGGIIFYLFITATFLGLILFVAHSTHTTIPSFISVFFLLGGLGLGIGGLVQATHIKTVSYTVLLPNAPSSWEGKRAVLVSDTHLGIINHKKFSNKVVDAILSINPDFVMHAGDFYDGPANDTTPITASWKRLSDRIPVFYAPGNHEEYGDYAGFLTSIKNANVTTLVDSMTLYEGVQIAGITYRDKNQSESAAVALKALPVDSTKPLILINHPPTFQDTVETIGTNLMVSGHTHRGQFWPLQVIVKRIYGKYIYGLNKDGSLITITTSGVGTAGPPLRLFNTPELVVITFTTQE